MNAIAHPHRIDSKLDLPDLARRAMRRTLPVAFAALVLALLLGGIVVLHLVTLGRTNPGIAALLHRLAQPLGLAS
ncbi:MAG TPA: hypothetical protein VEG27_07550 [Usitatibacter sp.]|nr:hypothetical protein [Usitatibacter sp.]